MIYAFLGISIFVAFCIYSIAVSLGLIAEILADKEDKNGKE